MNVVIVGAGSIGRYTAALLSKEKHHVILIDKDPKKLENLNEISIVTRVGDATDWLLLDNLLELSPDLFVAVTDDDETNLVACEIAKNLGYPKTVVRIRHNKYLNRTRLDFGRIFNIDYFLNPELLVANEISKFTEAGEALRVESFAHGALQLRTLVVPSKWKKKDKKIADLQIPEDIIIGLIRRKIDSSKENSYQIIFPHGNDHILPLDEITILGETEAIGKAYEFLGISSSSIKSALIIGGSLVGVNLAKLLEGRGIPCRIIEKDYNKCIQLAEILPRTTILNHDASDFQFLQQEQVERADISVSCTRRDEINILTSLLAKQAGCKNVVVEISNFSYQNIIENLGINHTVSPQVVAATHILSIALSETVSTIISLYDGEAELLEIKVSMTSKITGVPISELGKILPKDFLIGVIQNRGRIMIANGTRIISPGDTVIVISSPKHLSALQAIF
jgi:trk system potassium uptake protein TrkA